MLKGLKELPLISKILFGISLVILFVWVIPSMVNYFKNVQKQELKVSELQKSASKYGIAGSAKPFDKEHFIQEMLKSVSKTTVEFTGDKSYDVNIEIEKDKIDNFNALLETLSLQYLVEITSPLEFEEKDKLIEVKMSIREL